MPSSRLDEEAGPLSQVPNTSTGAAGSPSGPSSAVQTKIVVPDELPMVSVLGSGDELLHVAEHALDSDVHVRGNEITITGDPADNALAVRLFEELLEMVRGGQTLTPDAVTRTLGMLRSGEAERPADVLSLNILSRRGRTIRPKTLNQKRYVDAIDEHTIVFGIGPAGTGKTYLAMAKAVQALQSKLVNRIILIRPAVEAGERLGFLPGTLYEKIDPYLRPLYDALHDMVDPESIPRLTQSGTIEVAPLAYMRGRAQPVDTKVLTPDGFRPIGELSVGDYVVGSNGEPTPVLGVYPQGEKEIFRVATQDGAATLATADHLWAVSTRDDRRRNRPRRVLTTREMIGNLRAAHRHRYELPLVSQPVAFPSRSVPTGPYALGMQLGDGRSTGSTTPAVPTRRKPSGAVTTVMDPTTTIATFVPDAYLYNSAEVRLAVLQGLLDADGVLLPQGDRTCRISYGTTSAALRDDVLFLVRSLGGVANWRTRPAEGPEDAYIVDIRLPADVQPFRLERKLATYQASGDGRPMRFITSIEPAGTAESVCIQVAAADSLYVTEDFLVTHNTLNDAFIILDEAQNTTAEQMKMFLTRLGFGSKIVVTGDVTQIDLPEGQQSGLKVVRGILDGIEDVHFSILSSSDVVRHRLVSDIVDAYDRWDAERGAAANGRQSGNRDQRNQGVAHRRARGSRSR